MGVAGARAVEPGPALRKVPITFAIVGVQKAATSTLYRMLARHPRIAGGRIKERHFFDDETRCWDPPDYSDYHRKTGVKRFDVAGDATPIYLYWPHAMERMRAYASDMSLIAIFRDPIDRAFSQWSMERGRNPDFPDFGVAIRDERFTGLPAEVDPAQGARRGELRTRSIVGRGLYGQQLRRGLRFFDRSQWLLLDFRGFLAAPGPVLDRTTDFLGLERFRTHPEPQRLNVSPDDLNGVPPSGEDLAQLAEWYATDLAEFAELSGLDTSAWSTTRILAGSLDPAELAEKLARRAGLTR